MTDLMGVMANLFLPALKKRIFSFQFTNFPPPMEAYTKWELMLYNFNISNEVQNIPIHKFLIWISLKVSFGHIHHDPLAASLERYDSFSTLLPSIALLPRIAWIWVSDLVRN